MNRYILILFLFFLSAGVYAQQGYSYTQYMNSIVPFNPAASLLETSSHLQVIGRRQWTGIDDSPQTLLFNGGIPLKSVNASTGVIFAQEKYGVKSQTDVNAFFAKAINISAEGKLGVALNAGFNRYTANYNSLTLADPLFRDNVDQSHFNVGASVMWFTSQYYLGVSMPQFTTLWSDNSGPNKVNNQYYFTGGTKIKLNESFVLRPAALVSYTRSLPVMANLSTLVYVNESYGAGLDYQSNNMVSALLNMNFGTFGVGYSYQFYAGSGALNNLGGSHEVGLRYRFEVKKER